MYISVCGVKRKSIPFFFANRPNMDENSLLSLCASTCFESVQISLKCGLILSHLEMLAEFRRLYAINGYYFCGNEIVSNELINQFITLKT